jgi:multidrug efflux system membrane fusion protein
LLSYITDRSVSKRKPLGGKRHHPERLAMNRFIPVLVLALALAACSKPEPPPEPIRAVRTMVVTAGQAQGTQEFAAEVRARVESRLGFRVGGKMIRRQAELGQRVQAGQVLAELDPQDLRLGQEAARAAERSAQAAYDQAAADFKRFRELRDQGFISAAELDRRESVLKSAQGQLEQLRAQAGVQGNQAAYSQLVATASGVVTAVEAEVGAVLSAGMPVFRVAHDGPRDAVFAVPEDQVSAMRALQGKPGALRIRPWGVPPNAPTLPASVREVAAAADPATRTFLVKADLGQTSLALGQTATVLLDLPPVSGVARLPLPAVVQHEGKTSVWVVDRTSMTVQARPVEVSGADGNVVLVANGLKPGELVVTAGVHTVTPGQKVKLWQGDPATTAAAAPVASGVGPAASGQGR